MIEIAASKRDLRALMRERRADAFALSPDAPLRVRDLFLQGLRLPEGGAVSFYTPQGHEMDPRPLAEALASRGHPLCLPVVTGKNAPLQFRAYAFGDLLEAGVWSIPQPLSQAPAMEPDVLLVPLLAFDRRGYRLGYGGGYYDRTLSLLRSRKPLLAIGLAYAAQEVETVPADARDERLDAVVTEGEVIYPAGLQT